MRKAALHDGIKAPPKQGLGVGLSKGWRGVKLPGVGYLYTAFVIGVAVLINSLFDQWWERFKVREAQKPVTLEQGRDGVHAPRRGIVQKIQRVGHIMLIIWVIYILILIGLLIYSKLIIGRPLL